MDHIEAIKILEEVLDNSYICPEVKYATRASVKVLAGGEDLRNITSSNPGTDYNYALEIMESMLAKESLSSEERSAFGAGVEALRDAITRGAALKDFNAAKSYRRKTRKQDRKAIRRKERIMKAKGCHRKTNKHPGYLRDVNVGTFVKSERRVYDRVANKKVFLRELKGSEHKKAFEEK